MTFAVFVSFPRSPDLKFDMDHYLNVHVPLVCKLWGPYGMREWRAMKFSEGDASGLYLQTLTLWESEEGFHDARAKAGKEVSEDGEFLEPA